MNRLFSHVTACLLLLVTPFVVFLQHQGYSYLRPEILLCYLVFAGIAFALGFASSMSALVNATIFAALIALFVDIQFDGASYSILFGILITLMPAIWIFRAHAGPVLSLMAVTMLVSTLLLPKGRPTAPPAIGRGDDLPLTIHLLLDEHIGLEGLPQDLIPKGLLLKLKSFFEQNGFLLFGRAYSEYFNSELSISHLLNFSPGQHVPALYASGTDGFDFEYRLTRNDYFDRAMRQGYSLHVYQSDYMDLCPANSPRLTCRTYAVKGIGPVQDAPLIVTEKALVIASVYSRRSNAYTALRSLHRKARQRASMAGISLPPWNWERRRLSPLATMQPIQDLIDDVSAAQRGDFFFAHLLMPHFPYVYDEQCELRPLDQWLDRDAPGAPEGMTNTPETRATQYSYYGQQVRCLYRRVEAILGAIPAELLSDAIIIIHGDHGSRITLADPTSSGAPLMTASDYIDTYSTLFAVRAPRLEGGYDSRLVSIACLLKTLADNDRLSLDGLDRCETKPAKIFVGKEKERMVAGHLPANWYGPPQ